MDRRDLDAKLARPQMEATLTGDYSRMPTLPPLLPEYKVGRAIRVAHFHGMSVLLVAGLFALVSAMAGDRVGAIAGLLVAGAGAMERHGGMLLAHGVSRGIWWAFSAQLFAMVSILAYCQLRLTNVDLAMMRAAMTDALKAQLAADGIGMDEFLLFMNRAVFATFAAVTVLYQGGLAFYYLRRRRAVLQALASEE